jgi:hypothetical protein
MQSSRHHLRYIARSAAEVKIIADTIYKHLKNPPHFENPVIPTGAPADVSRRLGRRRPTTCAAPGTALHPQATNDQITGDQHGEIYNTTIAGTVHANQITLNSVLPVRGYPLPCHFREPSRKQNVRHGQHGRIRRSKVGSRQS